MSVLQALLVLSGLKRTSTAVRQFWRYRREWVARRLRSLPASFGICTSVRQKGVGGLLKCIGMRPASNKRGFSGRYASPSKVLVVVLVALVVAF